MSEIVFSRVGGFKFNGVTVDNMADDEIYLLEVVRNASPTLTCFDFIVPKRHGSKSYDNRYEDKYIDVAVGIYAKTAQERRQMQREFLQQIIGVEGKLSFNDEPNLFHFAKNYDEVMVEEDEIYTKLTISFKCSPFLYEFNFDGTDFTDELPTRLSITNTGTATTTNYGNFECNPIIEIIGTAALIIVTFNNLTSFSISNVSGTVYVDSDNMVVYTIVNGKKVSKLTDFQGLFPKIKKGENAITVGGTSVNTTTKIKYRNTYIC